MVLGGALVAVKTHTEYGYMLPSAGWAAVEAHGLEYFQVLAKRGGVIRTRPVYFIGGSLYRNTGCVGGGDFTAHG